MEFMTLENYTKSILEILSGRFSVKCAVAFWGAKSEDILTNFTKKTKNKIQIVCNLESGATNPYVIRKFLKYNN